MGARKEESQHLVARVDDDCLDQSHGAHFWHDFLVEVQRDGPGKDVAEESGRYEIGGRTMTMTEAFWLGICKLMNRLHNERLECPWRYLRSSEVRFPLALLPKYGGVNFFLLSSLYIEPLEAFDQTREILSSTSYPPHPLEIDILHTPFLHYMRSFHQQQFRTQGGRILKF